LTWTYGSNRTFSRLFVFFAIALFIICTVVLAFSQTSGQLLPASTFAYATCFGLTIYFLRNRMRSSFDLIVTAGATTFSGVWLYELAYHYFWGTSLASLSFDFSHLSITLYPGWPFPIWFATPVILFPYLKKQYIALNKPLLIVSAVAIGLFAIWFDLGLPQFFYPQFYYGTILSPLEVQTVGYVMNSLTKILAIVPAFLFCDRGHISFRQEGETAIVKNFRHAFFILFVGALILWMPLAGSIGFVTIAAGICVLGLSLRALRGFDSDQFSKFRSGWDRIIFAVVLCVSVLICGLIVITAPLGPIVETAMSNPNNFSMLNNLSQIIPNFKNILSEMVVLVIIVSSIVFYGWLEMCRLIRALGDELEHSRLAETARYYFLCSIIGLFSIIAVLAFILSGGSGLFLGTSLTTVHLYYVLFYGASYGFLIKGAWLFFSLVFILQCSLIAVGSFFAYRGLSVSRSAQKIAIVSNSYSFEKPS
jgi:hypothetical protein